MTTVPNSQRPKLASSALDGTPAESRRFVHHGNGRSFFVLELSSVFLPLRFPMSISSLSHASNIAIPHPSCPQLPLPLSCTPTPRVNYAGSERDNVSSQQPIGGACSAGMCGTFPLFSLDSVCDWTKILQDFFQKSGCRTEPKAPSPHHGFETHCRLHQSVFIRRSNVPEQVRGPLIVHIRPNQQNRSTQPWPP